MCCIVALLSLIFPRLVLLVLFFAGNYLERAYDSMLVLIAGFIFLPITTLAYAYAINTNGNVTGFYLVLVVVAVLLDLGVIGGGGHARRSRREG